MPNDTTDAARTDGAHHPETTSPAAATKTAPPAEHGTPWLMILAIVIPAGAFLALLMFPGPFRWVAVLISVVITAVCLIWSLPPKGSDFPRRRG